jgi:SOS response regulatory protein OraA/RecX
MSRVSDSRERIRGLRSWLMPSVTALRSVGRGRVAVELDGTSWRTVPAEAAVLAGLSVGAELDREAIRVLRRELRRLEALSAAAGALRYRDHTTASLDARLQRRGVAPVERQSTLATLSRAGILDDARVARERARTLAERGAGDLLIADDLERRGVVAELVDQALGSLDPELVRAKNIVERRGASRRTARFLTGKGFTVETVELVVADEDDGAVA